MKKLLLIREYNVVTYSIAVIFVNTRLQGEEYTEGKIRADMQEQIFSKYLKFEEVKVYEDLPKEQIVKVLQKLKQRAVDFEQTKQPGEVLVFGIVNIGYFLNLYDQDHISIGK
jgi:hypothetical protein